jgi:hypothetical protein
MWYKSKDILHKNTKKNPNIHTEVQKSPNSQNIPFSQYLPVCPLHTILIFKIFI